MPTIARPTSRRPLASVLTAAALTAGLAVGSLPLAGCTSVARGFGSLTANKYASPQSGSVWAVAPPQLEPPAPEDKTVYVSYVNQSDAYDLDLTGLMAEAARQQGWTVTNDPTRANYRLRARARFFGEVGVESGGLAQAGALGLVTGAAVGVGTYALLEDSWGGAGGAAAGAAVGGLIGLGLSNASQPREWALIVDFVLEEYSEAGFTYDLAQSDDTAATDSAGTGSGRMSAGGGSSQRTTSSRTITQQSNYYPHPVRLSVWANQMNMTGEEALPLIVATTERVVTQILPR